MSVAQAMDVEFNTGQWQSCLCVLNLHMVPSETNICPALQFSNFGGDNSQYYIEVVQREVSLPT